MSLSVSTCIEPFSPCTQPGTCSLLLFSSLTSFCFCRKEVGFLCCSHLSFFFIWILVKPIKSLIFRGRCLVPICLDNEQLFCIIIFCECFTHVDSVSLFVCKLLVTPARKALAVLSGFISRLWDWLSGVAFCHVPTPCFPTASQPTVVGPRIEGRWKQGTACQL